MTPFWSPANLEDSKYPLAFENIFGGEIVPAQTETNVPKTLDTQSGLAPVAAKQSSLSTSNTTADLLSDTTCQQLSVNSNSIEIELFDY